jgi:N-acetylmuramoyl-L-alanine amidase
LATAALALSLASPAVAAAPQHPRIVWRPVPFGAKRITETVAYEQRHYGLRQSTLVGPHVIVEHYTGNESLVATWATFASDAPDPELGEKPGTCTQFVVDRDGTIYQLVRLPLVCRHTVGLNWTAIGIEHVGTSDQKILHNPRQLTASLALTLWLSHRYRIPRNQVIGHSESLRSPYHHERYAAWRCQTHGDWTHPDMQVYRRKLAQLARLKHVSLPAGPPLRESAC